MQRTVEGESVSTAFESSLAHTRRQAASCISCGGRRAAAAAAATGGAAAAAAGFEGQNASSSLRRSRSASLTRSLSLSVSPPASRVAHEFEQLCWRNFAGQMSAELASATSRSSGAAAAAAAAAGGASERRLEAERRRRFKSKPRDPGSWDPVDRLLFARAVHQRPPCRRPPRHASDRQTSLQQPVIQSLEWNLQSATLHLPTSGFLQRLVRWMQQQRHRDPRRARHQE